MKSSYGNKLHHERFWGNLETKTKLSRLNDLLEQWSELYKIESSNKQIFTSIINGEKQNLTFNEYVEHKYADIKKFMNEYDDFESFIELGSGWGRNILYLQNYYPKLKYVACELSKAGRNITELFSNKYALNIVTKPFNYKNWKPLDLQKSKKAIVFTSYSVEQVSKLDKDLFYYLLETFDELVGYHIEPVLFQIENRKFPFKEYYNKHYNKNLYIVLQELQQEGKIKIIKSSKSVFCFGTNTTSQESANIIWQKI